MKILNIIKKILKLPFGLFVLPIMLVIGFFVTDWTDVNSRETFKEIIKTIIW